MRVVSLSAAASIVAAGAMIFLAGPPSVALADMVKAAEKHKLVKYTLKETFEDENNAAVKVGTSTYVGYADLTAPRFRQERPKILTLNGAVESSSYTVQDNTKNRILRVFTETVAPGAEDDPGKAEILRQVRENPGSKPFPRKEASLGTVSSAPGVNNKLTFLDNLRALQAHEDAVSSREDLRGRQTVKYVVEDGARTTTLWVDPETKLPVQMKVVQIGGGKLTYEYTDFEWDPQPKGGKGPDALFDTTPPDGYEVKDETNGR